MPKYYLQTIRPYVGRYITILALVAILCAGICDGKCSAALSVSLPDPTSTINGLPAAIQFHDAYSYSVALLKYWQDKNPSLLPVSTYGDYGATAGTGTLEILVMTQSNGATNSPTGLEDPIVTSGGNVHALSGYWGLGDQDAIPGSGDPAESFAASHRFSTVGEMRGAIGSVVPVFAFDYSEPASKDVGNVAMSISAQVKILRWNSTTSSYDTVDSFAFDTGAAGDPFNSALRVDVPRLVPTGDTGVTVDTSIGGGKFDFLEYAPKLDLANKNYLDSDLFVMYVDMTGLDGEGEELSISVAGVVVAIPEPASLAIWGVLGVIGAVVGLRRRAG